MRALAITGIDTAALMPSIISGSLIRATPPSRRMSAGTRSSAITAQAPASSAMRACSGVTTSMMTPPLSISARPRLTGNVPVARASEREDMAPMLTTGHPAADGCSGHPDRTASAIWARRSRDRDRARPEGPVRRSAPRCHQPRRPDRPARQVRVKPRGRQRPLRPPSAARVDGQLEAFGPKPRAAPALSRETIERASLRGARSGSRSARHGAVVGDVGHLDPRPARASAR